MTDTNTPKTIGTGPNQFTYYVEGLDREIQVKSVNSKSAHNLLWASLSASDKVKAGQIICIEQLLH